MSCPTCNANQNSTLENVHCETCGAVNCPTPSPCPEIIPTDCVIYTGDGKNCKEDPVYETGDSLSEVQAKIVDYFCEKVHTESTKKSNLPIPNTTVYDAQDDVNTALEKIVDWASTLINAVPSGVNLVSKSHAEMKTLQASSVGFQPGQWYLINDFRTIYEQPNYTGNSNTPANGIIIKEGPVQPIVVFAIAKDKLAPVAFQPDFPQDLIYYNLDYVTPKSSTATRGRITYRKDERGNECSWDFRNVKFLRYPDASGQFVSPYNTGSGSAQEFTVFSSYSTSFNNKIIHDSDNSVDNISNGFDLPNVVFLGSVRDSVLTGYIRNVTVTSNLGTSYFYGKDKLINILINSVTSVVKNMTLENINGFYCKATNEVSENQFLNKINTFTLISTSTVTRNVFKGIDQSVINCIDFIDNKIDRIVNANLSGSSFNFKNNNICSFLNNTFSSNVTFENNNFDEFNSNTIDNIFKYNKGGVCSENTFKSTVNNDLGPYFFDNTTGLNFGSSVDATANTIKAPFTQNTIGDDFKENTIDNKVSTLVIGNNFKLNHIQVALNGLNLSAATHVYADYNCKVYKNAGNNIKLSYYDAFDAEQTVLITN